VNTAERSARRTGLLVGGLYRQGPAVSTTRSWNASRVPTGTSEAVGPAARRRWSSSLSARGSASSIRLGLLVVAGLVAPAVGTDDPETLRCLAAVVALALLGTTLDDRSRLRLPALLARPCSPPSASPQHPGRHCRCCCACRRRRSPPGSPPATSARR
jgi:hypothetical protein